MGNVLLILLHRPFVSDGHLHSKPSIAVNSFRVCTTAATEITNVLRAYDRAFSIKRAPYLVSYATYVSATIHVRIAAQRELGSEAHRCLATCLKVFKENQETNWAVRRASFVINHLMKRTKVILGNEQGSSEMNHRPGDGQAVLSSNAEDVDYSSRASVANDARQAQGPPDLDINAIIQSFLQEQQNVGATTHIDRTGPADFSRNTVNDQWSHPFVASRIGENQGPYLGSGILERYPPDTASAHDGAHSWKPEDQNPEATFNDMLFGFDSSALDGIGWELDEFSTTRADTTTSIARPNNASRQQAQDTGHTH